MPPSPYSLRVETRLVDIGVVVRDPGGRAVAGLKQTDFQVWDDGRPRTITSFTVDTARAPQLAASRQPGVAAPPDLAADQRRPASGAKPPRYVLLFFDDANTSLGDLTHAQTAARRFVREGLAAGDLVAIMTSSGAHALEFTAGREQMVEAIGRLKAHPRIAEGGIAVCPRIPPYQAFLIAAKNDGMALKAAVDEAYACLGLDPPPTLQTRGVSSSPLMQTIKGQAEQTWDRVRTISETTLDELEAGVDYLATKPGSRMVVLVSSGFLAGTTERHQDLVVDHALRAGIVINALDAKGVYAEAPTLPPGELPASTMLKVPPTTFLFQIASVSGQIGELGLPLGNFAASTGGLYFRNNNDLDLAFREIGVEPEVTYHLGFSPDEVPADGKYHKLKVKVSGAKSDVIQARPGYFAPERAARTETKSAAESNRARLDHAVMGQDVRNELTAAVSWKPGPPLTITANVDVTALRFVEKDSRRFQHLTFVAALLDEQGNLVVAKEGSMDLALTEETYRKLMLTGLNAATTLQAPPGTYRLREVIQDALDGHIATANERIQVFASR